MKNTTRSRSTKGIGNHFEKQAKIYLEASGVKLIATNYFSKAGEIDIIGTLNGILIFFEVRSRSSNRFGHPEETITPTKQKRIINTANLFLQKHPVFQNSMCRFDVISIVFSDKEQKIEWIKNAFN